MTINLNDFYNDRTQIAYLENGVQVTITLENGGQIVITLDVDTQKAALACRSGDGEWHNSSNTRDWPALDRIFGRKQWQSFLADFENQILAALEEDSKWQAFLAGWEEQALSDLEEDDE